MPFSAALQDYDQPFQNLVRIGYRSNPTQFDEGIKSFERLSEDDAISLADREEAARRADEWQRIKRAALTSIPGLRQ